MRTRNPELASESSSRCRKPFGIIPVIVGRKDDIEFWPIFYDLIASIQSPVSCVFNSNSSSVSSSSSSSVLIIGDFIMSTNHVHSFINKVPFCSTKSENHTMTPQAPSFPHKQGCNSSTKSEDNITTLQSLPRRRQNPQDHMHDNVFRYRIEILDSYCHYSQ